MVKSVSGLGIYVKDPKKSASFYKKLGFRVENKKDVIRAYSNWFWIQFTEIETAKDLDKSFQKEAFGEPKGLGLYINASVQNIDKFYASLVKKGLKPSSKPRDWPWGNREFVIRDPDGYKIVFFEKLK